MTDETSASIVSEMRSTLLTAPPTLQTYADVNMALGNDAYAAAHGLTYLPAADGSPMSWFYSNSGVAAATMVDTSGNVIVVFSGTFNQQMYDVDRELVSGVAADSIPGMQDALSYYRSAVTAARADGHQGAVYVTGFSLGGTQAAYVGARTGAPGIGFGATGLPGVAPPASQPADFVSVIETGDPWAQYATDAAFVAAAGRTGADHQHYGDLLEIGDAGGTRRISALVSATAGLTPDQVLDRTGYAPPSVEDANYNEYNSLFVTYHRMPLYLSDTATAGLPACAYALGNTTLSAVASALKSDITAIVADEHLLAAQTSLSGTLSILARDTPDLAHALTQLMHAANLSDAVSAMQRQMPALYAAMNDPAHLAAALETLAGNLNPAFRQTGNTFTVSGGDAVIDARGVSGPAIVFTGTRDWTWGCTYIGGNSTIVTAGAGSAPVNIVSTGGNTVWASQTVINYTGGGASQIVMGATAGDSGTVNLSGDSSSSADTTQIDVWGSSGTTATVNKTGNMADVIFGGTSHLNFTGGNTTLVFSETAPTDPSPDVVWRDGILPGGGSATIVSTGSDTIWAGCVPIDFTVAGSGLDEVVLENGSVAIHGNADPSAALRVDDGGTGGRMTYTAGSETASLNLTATAATIQGGAGTLVLAAAAASTLSFIGGTGSSTLTLNGASSNVTAGHGALAISASAGTLTADLGAAVTASLTIDGHGFGGGSVTGFDPARDAIAFTAGSIASAHLASGGGLQILLADGQSLSIAGVTSTAAISQAGSQIPLG